MINTEHNSLVKSLLIKLALLLLGMFVLANSSFADLQPYQASYYVTFDRFSGRASMSLRVDPDSGEYTYVSITKPKGIAALFGKIREWATFKIDGKKVVANTFEHRSRDNESIAFDWENLKANSAKDGESKILELSGGEHDLLSLQMQLMTDLKNNALAPSYTVVTDNILKTYLVTPLGEENVKLGDKSYPSIKIKQQREGSSRHNVLWFAPELDYVVIKMEKYKGTTRQGTLSLTAYNAEDATKER